MPQIKDYSNFLLNAAVADAQAQQLNVAAVSEAGGEGDSGDADAGPQIERNAEGSEPGKWLDPGGTINVILFPHEPRQK